MLQSVSTRGALTLGASRNAWDTRVTVQASLALSTRSVEIHPKRRPPPLPASLSSQLPFLCTTMVFTFSFIIIHIKFIFSSVLDVCSQPFGERALLIEM